MNEDLRLESEKLARSWQQHDAAKLRDYLVSSVEDPRLNLQSVLTRHFLVTLLFGNEFEALKREEISFAVVMSWFLSMMERNLHADDWHAIDYALAQGADNAEGLELPFFLVRQFKQLTDDEQPALSPNYIHETLVALRDAPADGLPNTIHTFEKLWTAALAGKTAPPLSLAEVACGSANDYRFLHSYGIAPFIRYAGFDISERNIANAREMFPGVRFEVGNAFALPLEDQAVDACYFHDLLEHLSPAGMEQAVSEICRVTRRTICAGLFSAYEGGEDIVRPKDDYYCSTLSLPRLESLLRRHGFTMRTVHVDSLVRKRYPQGYYHNPNAYTVYADRT